MTIKDILVHLDSDPRSAVRLAVAAGLARAHGAHLTGLFVIEIPNSDYLYGAGFPASGFGRDQMFDTLLAEARAAAEPAEAAFQEALSRHGIPGQWLPIEGNAAAELSSQARFVDLVVVGQPDDPRRQDNRGRAIVETALMTSGRPLLAIPYAGEYTSLTDHVLVAWNASREATRAVHDALPLLISAAKVSILSIAPSRSVVDEPEGGQTGDIAKHLAHHSVQANTLRTTADRIPDGEALLSYAADVSATMIVAGGYGHSRARELIFGGVTRTLLAEMTVPVLFSH